MLNRARFDHPFRMKYFAQGCEARLAIASARQRQEGSPSYRRAQGVIASPERLLPQARTRNPPGGNRPGAVKFGALVKRAVIGWSPSGLSPWLASSAAAYPNKLGGTCISRPKRRQRRRSRESREQGRGNPSNRCSVSRFLRPGGMRACPAGSPVKAHAPVCLQVSNIRLWPSPREDIGATMDQSHRREGRSYAAIGVARTDRSGPRSTLHVMREDVGDDRIAWIGATR